MVKVQKYSVVQYTNVLSTKHRDIAHRAMGLSIGYGISGYALGFTFPKGIGITD